MSEVNKLRDTPIAEILSALKLQELVKERIELVKKECDILFNKGIVQGDRQKKLWILQDERKQLQSLVEESEK